MAVILLCVGRAAKTPEQDLCEAYIARAQPLAARLGFGRVELVQVETSRASQRRARELEEAERLSARLPPGCYRIALDERGKVRASEDFARHLAVLRDRGIRDIALIVGGPDGLAPDLREGADERLAFGPQTWPHLLVRAMAAEQIYRAFAILSGHPYHRGREAGAP